MKDEEFSSHMMLMHTHFIRGDEKRCSMMRYVVKQPVAQKNGGQGYDGTGFGSGDHPLNMGMGMGVGSMGSGGMGGQHGVCMGMGIGGWGWEEEVERIAWEE